MHAIFLSFYLTSLFKIRCRRIGIPKYCSFGQLHSGHSLFDIQFPYNHRFILRSPETSERRMDYFRPVANFFAGRQGRRWTRHQPRRTNIFGAWGCVEYTSLAEKNPCQSRVNPCPNFWNCVYSCSFVVKLFFCCEQRTMNYFTFQSKTPGALTRNKIPAKNFQIPLLLIP